FPGVLTENHAGEHVNGSNLGQLFYASYVDQQFVISRNILSTTNLASNIWIFQPAAVPNVTTTDNSYPQFNVLKFSNTYKAQWRIDGSDKVRTADADMIIISVNSTDSSSIDIGVYISTGYQRPTKDDSAKFLTIINSTVTDGFTQAEFKRPLMHLIENQLLLLHHRNLQILGAICVGIFGAVAMSSATIHFRVPNGIVINGPNRQLYSRIPEKIYELLPTNTLEEFCTTTEFKPE
ncbi:17184_t:CDS:2, partial [Dentiscutata erythropus]